jgi:hypothetical protein
MPQYQPAILKLVEAIKALPQLDQTEEQIRARKFEQKGVRWRDMEAFDEIWWKAWQREYYPSNKLLPRRVRLTVPLKPHGK